MSKTQDTKNGQRGQDRLKKRIQQFLGFYAKRNLFQTEKNQVEGQSMGSMGWRQTLTHTRTDTHAPVRLVRVVNPPVVPDPDVRGAGVITHVALVELLEGTRGDPAGIWRRRTRGRMLESPARAGVTFPTTRPSC